MDDALYVAATGMHAIQRMVDNSAHNAVNSQTPGYQNRRLLLQNFGSFLDRAEGREHLIGSRELIAFEQGDLRQDDGPYAVGLEGDGFLAVRDDAERTFFTRNGDLTLSADGKLITRAGYELVAESGGAIVIDPVQGGVKIETDGAVVQNGAEIGRLQVREFAPEDRARLVPAGETLFRVPEGVEAQAATGTTVRQGYLEFAPHGGVKSLVDMLLANKNYEAMQRTIRALDRVHSSLLQSDG